MAPRALFSIRALNHVSGPAVTSPRPPTRTAHCPRAALVFLFSHALLVEALNSVSSNWNA